MKLLRFDLAANFRQIELQNDGNLFERESRNRFAATFAMRGKPSAFGANNRDAVRFNRYLCCSIHHFFFHLAAASAKIRSNAARNFFNNRSFARLIAKSP